MKTFTLEDKALRAKAIEHPMKSHKKAQSAVALQASGMASWKWQREMV